MGKKLKENCILCAKVVTTRQHAIQCDSWDICGSTENVKQVGMYGLRHFNIVQVNSVSLKS